MLTLTANKSKDIKVPSSWFETSTELFQKIIREWDMDKPIAERDRIKLFSIISGQEYTEIEESEDYHLQSLLEAVCAYVYYKDLPTNVTDTFKIKDKVVTIPKDLSGMTTGQAIIIRQKMDTVKDIRELISFACAVFLQPYYDGVTKKDRFKKAKFDMDRVRELEPFILDMSITYTYPIGFFFLQRLNKSGMMPIRNYPGPRPTLWRRWLQSLLGLSSYNRFFTWVYRMFSRSGLAWTQTKYITSLSI